MAGTQLWRTETHDNNVGLVVWDRKVLSPTTDMTSYTG